MLLPSKWFSKRFNTDIKLCIKGFFFGKVRQNIK